VRGIGGPRQVPLRRPYVTARTVKLLKEQLTCLERHRCGDLRWCSENVVLCFGCSSHSMPDYLPDCDGRTDFIRSSPMTPDQCRRSMPQPKNYKVPAWRCIATALKKPIRSTKSNETNKVCVPWPTQDRRWPFRKSRPEEVHHFEMNPPPEWKPCSGNNLSLAQKMLSDVEPLGGDFRSKDRDILISWARLIHRIDAIHLTRLQRPARSTRRRATACTPRVA